MKINSSILVIAAALTFSACSEKIPTACECYQALKVDGREAKIFSKCDEMKKADEDFETAVRQCAANDILRGNTKVEKASTGDLVVPESGTYEVEPTNSAVTWTAKKITGKTHFGSVLFSSGSIQFENNTIQNGEIIIDMTSIEVLDIKEEEMKAKLQGHLNSADFFDTAKFPTAKYTITSVEKGENSSFKLNGNMTIKGITQEVPANILLTLKGDLLVGGGTLSIDRSKFDVKYGSGSFFDNLGDDLIEDEISFKIKIIAKASGNPA